MSRSPLHRGGDESNIYVLALIRYSDKAVVASSSFGSSGKISIEGVRECIAGAATLQPTKRFTSQGESFAIHFQLDAQGRVYSIVTSPSYSPRVAFMALDELVMKVRAEIGHKVSSASEGSLSRACTSIFSEIYDRYNIPSKADALTAVQEKVEIVKTTMKENIQQLLINQENLEKIESAAIHLNEQSVAFHSGSKQLANKMFWKMWKMRILIGFLVTAVLIIIIVPFAVMQKK